MPKITIYNINDLNTPIFQGLQLQPFLTFKGYLSNYIAKEFLGDAMGQFADPDTDPKWIPP